MNGAAGNGRDEPDIDDDDDVEFADSPEDTVVITEDDDDIDEVGDISAELNVEELVAKIEKGDLSSEHRKQVRRRLEELEEERRARKELDSTYNFNLDDEV